MKRTALAILLGLLLPAAHAQVKDAAVAVQETEAVVTRQLVAACSGLDAGQLGRMVIAYEPVWAIGTGRNATPDDAASVHRTIRQSLTALGAPAIPILYGGSVNKGNIESLVARPEIEGVLVGGASLDPDGWADVVQLARRVRSH